MNKEHIISKSSYAIGLILGVSAGLRRSMKLIFAGGVALIALMAVIGFTGADRLPSEMPENQAFTIDTVVDVTGAVDHQNKLKWVIADAVVSDDDSHGGAIPTGSLGDGQVVADIDYKDTILTNGGKFAENKNFGFDSRNQETGLYNIESEKVLTYASTEGAHMVGEEQYTLSVAGNWVETENNIRCVFSDNEAGLPAFCNIVEAKSGLVNVNSAQISTKGQIRATAETVDTPAELNYQIAVTPDANSGSGFAEGTVITSFAGSIMEARSIDDYYDAEEAGDAEPYYANSWNKTAATNSWKDSHEVTGGIKNFQKSLAYQSGFML